MDLETYIQSLIEHSQSYMGKAQIQRVISHHIPSYALQTRETEGATTPATAGNVKILTPYAGDGFGMVCSPSAGSNIVTLPLRSKGNAVVALGKTFVDSDEVPRHKAGDFLIEHETHSKLLFQISQPPISPDGIRYGDVLKGKTTSPTTSTERTFEIELIEDENEKLPPLRNRENIYVYYGIKPTKMAEASEKIVENFGPGGALYAWKATVVLNNDVATVSIGSSTMDFPGVIPDYSDIEALPDEDFVFMRVSPNKGFVMLAHYTGSALQFEEDPDYKTIFKRNEFPRTVRYNRNAVLAEPNVVSTKESEKGAGDDKPITLSRHRPKGSLVLKHYSQSGLKISETDPQIHASNLKMELSLIPNKPIGTSMPGESSTGPMPSAQVIFEDITQSDVDVATRMAFRHLTSAVFDEDTCETDYSMEVLPQKETGHFGIDHVNKEEIALEGSGIFIRDYLRKYDETTKGWRFVSLTEAETYYEENREKFYKNIEGYEIEEIERIVPASGRRDVLLREKDLKDVEKPKKGEPDVHDVKLASYDETVDADYQLVVNDKKTRNDDNKELIGQKGYTYKTQAKESPVKEKTFEDGYLCFPKGDIGFRHYTRSGVEVRELEPNLDYHGLQAAFSLFAWDNGQYFQPHHAADKDRNFRNMKFGPYPLPLGQLLIENAKTTRGQELATTSSLKGIAPTLDELSKVKATEVVESVSSAMAETTAKATPQLATSNSERGKTSDLIGEVFEAVKISIQKKVADSTKKINDVANSITGFTTAVEVGSEATNIAIVLEKNSSKHEKILPLKSDATVFAHDFNNIQDFLNAQEGYIDISNIAIYGVGGNEVPPFGTQGALYLETTLDIKPNVNPTQTFVYDKQMAKREYTKICDFKFTGNKDAIITNIKVPQLNTWKNWNSAATKVSGKIKSVIHPQATAATLDESISLENQPNYKVLMNTDAIGDLINTVAFGNTELSKLLASYFHLLKKPLAEANQIQAHQILGEIPNIDGAENLATATLPFVQQKWLSKQDDIKKTTKLIQKTWDDNGVVSDEFHSAENEAQALADIRSLVDTQRIFFDIFLKQENKNTASAPYNKKLGKSPVTVAPISAVTPEATTSQFFTGASSINTLSNDFITNADGEDVVTEDTTTEETASKDVVFPTPLIPHTSHPQPDIWEDSADKNRTTLSLPGETATWMGLYQHSSHIQTVANQVTFSEDRIGSRLLFRDYVMQAKPDDDESHLIAAAKWENERGMKHNLIAPKGSVELHHYTHSGLTIADKRPHYLNKHGGGHAMSMRMEMRSLDFVKGLGEKDVPAIAGAEKSLNQLGGAAKLLLGMPGLSDDITKTMAGEHTETVRPVPLFDKPDGSFFCEILSNELVDKGDEYKIKKVEKETRFIEEKDSVRGKLPEKPHGKRGAWTGITHDTTRTENHDMPAHLWFEDYIVKIEKESDDIEGVLQPTHLYDELEEGKTRKLLMPRGYAAFEFYNKSAIVFGDDVTDIEKSPEDLDNLERGRYQKAFTMVSLQEWNNMKIEDGKTTPAAPFDEPSALLSMSCIADEANVWGKDATQVLLIQKSSQQKDKGELGTALLFEDFIKDSGEHQIPCHGYKEDDSEDKRLPLTFPKGKLILQAYNHTGLFIEDLIPSDLEEQQISLRLAMREWDNAEPDQKGNPFDQDTAYLEALELCPKATKEGKRAVSVKLETLTSSTNANNPGSMLFIKDFVDEEMPSHLYEEDAAEGLKPTLFPKGELGFLHYTQSGLYVTDQETTNDKDKHKMLISLAMREWDNTGEGKEAIPFDKDSASLVIEELCSESTKDGKRAAQINIETFTSSANENNPGTAFFIKDFVDQDMPSHIYTEGNDAGGLKDVVFPKGELGILHYTQSGLYVTDQETTNDKAKHKMLISLAMREWDNSGDGETAEPFDEDSASLVIEELCSDSTVEGKRAISINLENFASSAGDTNPGSAFFIKDFVDQDMPSHIYTEGNDAGGLKDVAFPKGELGVLHYTTSGLYITDEEERNDKAKHKMHVSLAMCEWDNSGDGETAKPFDEDSTSLIMTELCPDSTKEGKRASRVTLEAFTSKSDGAPYGSNLNFEDFLDNNKPAHIFEGGGAGLQKPKMPKGKVELLHYTTTGLILEDLQTSNDESKHQPSAILRLREWGESQPEETDLAQFFAWDTMEEKSKRAILIGFNHEATQSRCFLLDENEEKDDHKMQCAMYHWDTSYLKFSDLTDKDNKQVDIKLHHMKDSYLLMHQKNENPGDMLVDLHHTKSTGYKIDNDNDDVTQTIYHKSGSMVEIDPDGNITATSVKDIIANAAENVRVTAGEDVTVDAAKNVSVTASKEVVVQAGTSARITAPDIILDGKVRITGEVTCEQSLTVAQNINAGSYNTAPGNLE